MCYGKTKPADKKLSVLACFFTPLRMKVYKLRPLLVFPHISDSQLGGVAFTASIFVCITRSKLNLTTGTNALCLHSTQLSLVWCIFSFDLYLKSPSSKAPCAEGAILNFECWIVGFQPMLSFWILKPHPRAASRLTPPLREGSEWLELLNSSLFVLPLKEAIEFFTLHSSFITASTFFFL